MKRFARRSRGRALRQLIRRALALPRGGGLLSLWKVSVFTLTANAA